MRTLIAAFALLAILVGLPAAADVYGLKLTMPSPGGSTAQCEAFIGSVAQALKPCGSVQTYANVFPSEGTYLITYRTVDAAGVRSAGASPALTLVIVKLPPTPTNPPSATVECYNGTTPVTCPTNIVITSSP